MWKLFVWPIIIFLLIKTPWFIFHYPNYFESDNILVSLVILIAVYSYMYAKISAVYYVLLLLLYVIFCFILQRKLNYWVFIFMGPLSLVLSFLSVTIFSITNNIPQFMLTIIGNPGE